MILVFVGSKRFKCDAGDCTFVTQELLNEVEDAALTVHSVLGSGWTETVYHSALERELSERGVPFHSEGTIPVMYKGAPVGRRRPDLFVMDKDGNTVLLELKAGTSTGQEQVAEYVGMARKSDEFEDVFGGLLVGFNESLETEAVVVTGDGESMVGDMDVEMVESLSTGTDVYHASVDDYTMEVQVDTMSGSTFVPMDDMYESTDVRRVLTGMAVDAVKMEVGE